MRTLMLAGAAALALTSLPAALSAQSQAAQQTEPTPPTANQANARAQPGPATTTIVQDNNPATPTAIVRNNPGNLTAPPASALNKTYPVCTRTLQDSCRNPGEGESSSRSRSSGD